MQKGRKSKILIETETMAHKCLTLMEAVPIVIQHPPNPLYPMVKDEIQFRPLIYHSEIPECQ
jgi:hypothetical protein